MRTPTMAYDIQEWMWGVEEDAPKVEARNGNVINHRPEQRNAHSQHTGQASRQHRRQRRPQFPRDTSGGSPSSGVGVLIREVIKVPGNQPWWGCQEKATDLGGQEGVLGEGQSADLQGWKDQTCSNIPLMALGHSYSLLLRLGWPAFAAMYLPVIVWVPRTSNQESRQGCCPKWCPPDVGWALWYGDDVHCPG